MFQERYCGDELQHERCLVSKKYQRQTFYLFLIRDYFESKSKDHFLVARFIESNLTFVGQRVDARSHSLSPSGRLRLCEARTNQSAGLPSASARSISATDPLLGRPHTIKSLARLFRRASPRSSCSNFVCVQGVDSVTKASAQKRRVNAKRR